MDWKTFTPSQWAGFTVKGWDTFLVDPDGKVFFLDADGLHVQAHLSLLYAPEPVSLHLDNQADDGVTYGPEPVSVLFTNQGPVQVISN